MPLTIRRPHPTELDAVGELTARAYLSDGLVPDGSGYADRLRDARARDDEAELLAAVDDESGAVLGTVTFVVPGTPWAEISQEGEAEFRMLAVAPEARRHGVARQLVAACVERATTRSATALVICSATDMPGAHRLYESFGFRRLPERDWSPIEGVTLWAFWLPLVAQEAG